MNVPLRALSWAVRFFWIIAIAFAITGVYSATLIRVNFGEPTVNLADEDLIITLPIIFDNKGYYNLADLNITSRLADYESNRISEDYSYITQIPPQSNTTILHNVSINLNEMITQSDYLFNDSDFNLCGSIYLNYASLIPFGFELNTTIPWGAPLYNFAVVTPQYSVYNATHLRVYVPISFENHSPYFNVTGTIRIELLNDRNRTFGESNVSVDVPANAFYDGGVEVLVNARLMTTRGQIRLYVETSLFNYGPVVINYG